MNSEKRIGLCHRCNHRATYLESGYAPRMECKSNGAVGSCYAFKNVIPLALKSNADDDRPVFAGALFSARCHGINHEEQFMLDLIEHEDGSATAYWKPVVKKTIKKGRSMKHRKLEDMDTNAYEGVEYWVSVCYIDAKKDGLVGPFNTERSAFIIAQKLEQKERVLYAVVTSTPLAKCLSHRAEITVV